MSRFTMLLCLPLIAGGCATDNAAPDVLPKGTETGMYTNRDPQTVAACIAAVLGTTPQVTGDRIVVASSRNPDLRYSIGATKKSGAYSTQIAVFGQEADADEAQRVGACASNGSGQ